MDRLKTMEVFVEVIKCGSFAEAARQMGLSRPIVTNYVRGLEKRLGMRLINRTTRHLSLTEIGKEYFDLCTGVLENIATGEDSLKSLQMQPQGHLRILAPKSFGTLHMSKAIAEFSKAHPDMTTSLVLRDLPPRTFDFIHEKIDVAIRPAALPNSSMMVKKLSSSKWILCASPSFLKVNGEPQSLNDLKTSNCLIQTNLAPDCLWRFKSGSKTISIKVGGNFNSNSVLVLRDAAIAGLGIALLPKYCLEDTLKRGALRQVLPRHKIPEKPLYILFPSSKSMPEKVRAFVDFMTRWYSDPQAGGAIE